MAMLEIDLPGL